MEVFSERAHDTSLRDMLDLVALDLKLNHESEIGSKQSFNYDVSLSSNETFLSSLNILQVRHFYKKLYFAPGLRSESRDLWRLGARASSCRENRIRK